MHNEPWKLNSTLAQVTELAQNSNSALEKLRRPEIVGEVRNPLLEAVRRLWWRAFDPVCGFFVLIRLSILDRIYGPELPTSADIQREADQERLVRALPAAGKAIEPTDYGGQNRDGEIGSPYS